MILCHPASVRGEPYFIISVPFHLEAPGITSHLGSVSRVRRLPVPAMGLTAQDMDPPEGFVTPN